MTGNSYDHGQGVPVSWLHEHGGTCRKNRPEGTRGLFFWGTQPLGGGPRTTERVNNREKQHKHNTEKLMLP